MSQANLKTKYITLHIGSHSLTNHKRPFKINTRELSLLWNHFFAKLCK